MNYVLSDLTKIEEEIEKIDKFIEANKPDVDLSYALEQTKGIESEIILIDEFYKQIEVIVDKTEEDLQIVKAEYNEAIKSEKSFNLKMEQIQNSIEVAFEDVDTTNFAKLRSCDKQLEEMNCVKAEVSKVEEIISKLELDTENRMATVISLDADVDAQQLNFAQFENKIAMKEQSIAVLREERESLLESLSTLLPFQICPQEQYSYPNKFFQQKCLLRSQQHKSKQCLKFFYIHVSLTTSK